MISLILTSQRFILARALHWPVGAVVTAVAFAVLDPTYTMTVPSMQVLSGAFDTLSHAMEIYLGHSD